MPLEQFQKKGEPVFRPKWRKNNTLERFRDLPKSENPPGRERALLAALLFLAFMLGALSQARAQSCNFTISDMSFGAVDTLSGGAVNGTATINVNCTGLSLTRILICPSIGVGSGGATVSARQMTSGGDTLAYQLYSDAGRTAVWGSYFWGFAATPPTLELTLGVLGSGAASFTLYGQVFGGQSTVPAGTYLSAFSGADMNFIYRYTLLSDCSNLSGQTASPSFTVTASIADNCLVTTQDLDFGAHGVLTGNVDTTGGVTVTCTPGTAYTVGLDGGQAAAPPAARLMSKGSETVTYGLYQDAARSLPWGLTAIPGEAVPGTGSGSGQVLTVYGRVPPQTTPSPGTYTDTVVVTVTY
ncbi:Spore coat protein u [Nitratireductor aquimarinus]